MRIFCSLAALIFAMTVFADERVVYVATPAEGGSDATGTGEYAHPYATISNAIVRGQAPTPRPTWLRVSVRPGRYPGCIRVQNANYGLVDIRAQKRVGSTDVDNPNPAETVIDGALSNSHCVYLAGYKTVDGVSRGHNICGFTLQNGIWTPAYGLADDAEGNYCPVGCGGLLLNDWGTASNLVVRYCSVDTETRVPKASNPPQLAAVCVQGHATLEDSFIYSCTNRAHAGAKTGELNGAGLKISGGNTSQPASVRVSRCVISNCWSFTETNRAGNRRGGGVYFEGVGNILESCKILDCGYGGSNCGKGGGICTITIYSVISNCFVSGCRVAGNNSGGGICGDYGAWIEDTTVTNCWTESGRAGGIDLSVYPTPRELGLVRRCHVVDCQRDLPGRAFYQNHGTVEDCLIENNRARYGIYGIAGHHSILRGSVVRNNYSANGGVVAHESYGDGTATVSRCWIEGNTANNAAVGRYGTWSRSFYLDNCIVRSNRTNYAVFAYYDSSQGGTTDDQMTVQIQNCTVVDNYTTYRNSAFGFGLWSQQYYVAGSPYAIGVTNCLVTGNYNYQGKRVPAFDDFIKKNGRVGQIAYCAMATNETANLPDDPNGIAHNQAGRLDFMPGTLTPHGASVAVDNGATLPWMIGAKDMGDGSYTITKSADYGVHITPNNARRRIIGAASDIGACEFLSKGFILIFVR